MALYKKKVMSDITKCMPMKAKLCDPDCTCSECTEQWSMWTEVFNCGLWSTFVDFGPQTLVHICGPGPHWLDCDPQLWTIVY